MADMGTSRLMQDGSRSSNGARILGRIAAVLDIPVADFYQPDTLVAEGEVPSIAECERMLTAFLRVRDPDARARIITLMRTYSDN